MARIDRQTRHSKQEEFNPAQLTVLLVQDVTLPKINYSTGTHITNKNVKVWNPLITFIKGSHYNNKNYNMTKYGYCPNWLNSLLFWAVAKHLYA